MTQQQKVGLVALAFLGGTFYVLAKGSEPALAPTPPRPRAAEPKPQPRSKTEVITPEGERFAI